MTGKEVKALIKSTGVKLWEVAEVKGMKDCEFSRRLRHTFSDDEVSEIKDIIKTLSVQNAND